MSKINVSLIPLSKFRRYNKKDNINRTFLLKKVDLFVDGQVFSVLYRSAFGVTSQIETNICCLRIEELQGLLNLVSFNYTMFIQN